MKPESCQALWAALREADPSRKAKYLTLTQDEVKSWVKALSNVPDDKGTRDAIVSRVVEKNLLIVPTLGVIKAAWKELVSETNENLKIMDQAVLKKKLVLEGKIQLDNKGRKALNNAYHSAVSRIDPNILKKYNIETNFDLPMIEDEEKPRPTGARINPPLANWRNMVKDISNN